MQRLTGVASGAQAVVAVIHSSHPVAKPSSDVEWDHP